MGVDRLSQRAVAGNVDEGRRVALERVDRVVGDSPVVDPQPRDDLGVARRGQPYQSAKPLSLARVGVTTRCDEGGR